MGGITVGQYLDRVNTIAGKTGLAPGPAGYAFNQALFGALVARDYPKLKFYHGTLSVTKNIETGGFVGRKLSREPAKWKTDEKVASALLEQWDRKIKL
jgi:hypothetical protein